MGPLDGASEAIFNRQVSFLLSTLQGQLHYSLVLLSPLLKFLGPVSYICTVKENAGLGRDT